MEFVVMYSLSEGIDLPRVLERYPRHKAYYEAFHAGGGGLLALGRFQTMDPAGASMAILTSREDAERFIAGDPFILEGLAAPRILEWNAVRFD
ncbi:hypothetical protein [Arthrobacter globiformis]|uniref:hypothetical protein n=1 Tax=Arthrobacter globiformis TaxID=1665 RepID=UPI0027905A7E|nr:hypothetical protein [Arthrobacter globiformis]MDQ0618617.1 uncharacterized protein YciI [Arthrobacter globiformis]